MAEPITELNIEALPVYPQHEKYTLDETIDDGLAELFNKFTQGFERYVSNAAEIGQEVIDTLNRKEEKSNIWRDYINKSGSYHCYKEFLQRACFAASRIAKKYDLGIGIGRKGFWLSYVFNLLGLPTKDILVLRKGNNRAAAPLSVLTSSLVRGKKVLLFDNDVVTGDTLNRVVNEISRAAPKYVDLLLIYRDTRIFPNCYARAQSNFKGKPQILGRTPYGRLVIDTSCEVPREIRRTMSLEYDFNREFRDAKHGLDDLARRLGVSLVEPSPQFHPNILRQKKREQTPKIVSFDLDGTILDREFDYCLWGSHDYEGGGVLWEYIAGKLGISREETYQRALAQIDNVPCGEVSPRAWIRYFGLGNNKKKTGHSKEGIMVNEENIRASERGIRDDEGDIRANEENINAAEKEIVDAVCSKVNVRVNEDYKGLIKEMRRKIARVIICTEASGYMLEKKLESAGIKDDFDAVYSSVDLMGIRKGRRFYTKVLELEGLKLQTLKSECLKPECLEFEGISPEEMIHIGDSAKRDYHKPRALGIIAYYIDVNRELQCFNPTSDQPMNLIPNEYRLSDLRQILEELR